MRARAASFSSSRISRAEWPSVVRYTRIVLRSFPASAGPDSGEVGPRSPHRPSSENATKLSGPPTSSRVGSSTARTDQCKGGAFVQAGAGAVPTGLRSQSNTRVPSGEITPDACAVASTSNVRTVSRRRASYTPKWSPLVRRAVGCRLERGIVQHPPAARGRVRRADLVAQAEAFRPVRCVARQRIEIPHAVRAVPGPRDQPAAVRGVRRMREITGTGCCPKVCGERPNARPRRRPDGNSFGPVGSRPGGRPRSGRRPPDRSDRRLRSAARRHSPGAPTTPTRSGPAAPNGPRATRCGCCRFRVSAVRLSSRPSARRG